MRLAAETFDVELRARDEPWEPSFLRRFAVGTMGRRSSRFEVTVLDRETRTVVLTIPADGTHHEARALFHVIHDATKTLHEKDFLRTYGRWHRRMRR